TSGKYSDHLNCNILRALNSSAPQPEEDEERIQTLLRGFGSSSNSACFLYRPYSDPIYIKIGAMVRRRGRFD
ncbi:MAG: hypothetical protein OXG11_11780, partial [Chloroflexi bacterium]|nr:hypothetical protein [Chloroflexota bacterium]